MGIIQIKGVPDKLHNRFKAACALEGVNMTEKIIELMDKYLDRKQVERLAKEREGK